MRPILLLAAAAVLTACRASPAPAPAPSPQDAFWESLLTLCGDAFAGTVVQSVPEDPGLRQPLVMHVRECGDSTIRIPFHIGENRSRTWVLTRTETGLRLKHDHRHEDGQPDSVTWYGGDTPHPGSPTTQEFAADGQTAELIPAARTNLWTVEVIPGERFSYMLRREGTERRFRADFDLTRRVPAPPPPWGS